MPYVGRMPSQHCPLYHYRVKDKVVGPVSLADLHVLLTSKKIPPDTMIREEHCQTWMPLTAEFRRQERLARPRTSAALLACRPPKSSFLFMGKMLAYMHLLTGGIRKIPIDTPDR